MSNILDYTRAACIEARKTGRVVAMSPHHLMLFVHFVEAMAYMRAQPQDRVAQQLVEDTFGKLTEERT